MTTSAPPTTQWEVADSYDVVRFTGTLEECGLWIDPLFGIDFDAPTDEWRVDRQDDGSFVVGMYHDMGHLTVRRAS